MFFAFLNTFQSELLDPAFLFVPGAFRTPFLYEPILLSLRERGFQAEAVSFPTIGSDPSVAKYGLIDEIGAVQGRVAEIVDGQHRDVILVCHSYGGWPGSRAVHGWDRPTQEAQGKNNDIVRLIFLSAFLLPERTNVQSLFGDGVRP